jgi:hypothetical protein
VVRKAKRGVKELPCYDGSGNLLRCVELQGCATSSRVKRRQQE